MNKPQNMNLAARLAIGAMCILGFIGGCIIVAYGGYETSPKRGGTSVFVPLPEAAIIALMFYTMSVLALLALLRYYQQRIQVQFFALVLYFGLAYVVTRSLDL